MLRIYNEWRDGVTVKRFSESRERRLTNLARKSIPDYMGYVSENFETDLARCNKATEYEYDLPVRVKYGVCPGQRGGWTDPSWDAYVEEVWAYYYRAGKGWVELDLTSSEEDRLKDEATSHYENQSDY